ncbi:hypothetical protein DXT99_20870 [Pontibacter diazotrophicus]|uniref:DUF4890 domain-containing protein n=1 Tax=Pontibacter diazotrophicus TaxID=1400979 RepID=A0A3D8L719_9BACT|nr:hypothetical protein [Pontibacter diazotrophicus]RDV13198.1 hypothetical protein DXT99_20870 [Pontibacter diazotrophicus]
MKKLTLLIFTFGIILLYPEANAQTSQSSTLSAKDEYWGTAKVERKGTSVDAADRRAAGLDTRFNAYENDRRRSFDKKKIANSKRMKEILKKEKKMMKKHKRDKRRLRRSQ